MGFRQDVDAYCATLPGAIWADPADGELPSWKVGGKMFASLGHVDPGVSVKTADIETAQMLIETGEAIKAPYFHRSWVRFLEDADMDEVQHRLRGSYTIIRSKLPKKLRDSLALLEDS